MGRLIYRRVKTSNLCEQCHAKICLNMLVIVIPKERQAGPAHSSYDMTQTIQNLTLLA